MVQILVERIFRYDLWVGDGLPLRYYEWAETVESLRDSGEMLQVRFE